MKINPFLGCVPKIYRFFDVKRGVCPQILTSFAFFLLIHDFGEGIDIWTELADFQCKSTSGVCARVNRQFGNTINNAQTPIYLSLWPQIDEYRKITMKILICGGCALVKMSKVQ